MAPDPIVLVVVRQLPHRPDLALARCSRSVYPLADNDRDLSRRADPHAGDGVDGSTRSPWRPHVVCGHRRHRRASSVRVCSPASRRFAPLRPRCAGLTALTPAPRTLVQIALDDDALSYDPSRMTPRRATVGTFALPRSDGGVLAASTSFWTTSPPSGRCGGWPSGSYRSFFGASKRCSSVQNRSYGMPTCSCFRSSGPRAYSVIIYYYTIGYRYRVLHSPSRYAAARQR